MPTSNLEQIIIKINKLRALAVSSNIHEAAAAAAAANKLIDEYRLSEADLEISGIQSEEPLEEDAGYIYESGRITAWKTRLVNTLVKHYGLSVWNDASYSTGRMVSRYRLVGRKSDITIAKYMFNWLTLECKRLADLYAKGCGRIYHQSYCDGFVAGISDQLAVSRNEIKNTATSAALVKIDERSQLAKQFRDNLHKDLISTKKYSYTRTDYGAYADGRISGKNFHLGQTLDGKAPRVLK